jgi:YHS domain-containing protein
MKHRTGFGACAMIGTILASAVLMNAAAQTDPAAVVKDTTKTAVAKADHNGKAASHKLKPQTTCPVMGGAIDKNQYVDYKGKRIYVCCPDCIDKVKKNPEKYIKKLEKMGQGVETIGDEKKNTSSDGKEGASMKGMDMKDMKMTGDPASKAAQAGYWTCPMHPEIHQAKAGQCPKCGMNLEYKETAKEGQK